MEKKTRKKLGENVNFKKYKTIQEFYDDTGMTPEEAYYFLKKELEK